MILSCFNDYSGSRRFARRRLNSQIPSAMPSSEVFLTNSPNLATRCGAGKSSPFSSVSFVMFRNYIMVKKLPSFPTHCCLNKKGFPTSKKVPIICCLPPCASRFISSTMFCAHASGSACSFNNSSCVPSLRMILVVLLSLFYCQTPGQDSPSIVAAAFCGSGPYW